MSWRRLLVAGYAQLVEIGLREGWGVAVEAVDRALRGAAYDDAPVDSMARENYLAGLAGGEVA